MEVQDQGVGKLGFSWGLSPGLADGHLLTVSSHGLKRPYLQIQSHSEGFNIWILGEDTISAHNMIQHHSLHGWLSQWLKSSFFFLIYLYFIYFWLRWVFVAARRLSLVEASGGYSSLWCAGFSLRWLPLLRSTGSRCADFSSCGSRALERRLSSCGARA